MSTNTPAAMPADSTVVAANATEQLAQTNTLTSEVRDVVGYEGWYQVTDQGEVIAVKREITQFNPVIKRGYSYSKPVLTLVANPNETGILMVNLSKDNKRKKRRVARLVAEAFLPLPEGDLRQFNVNYKDGDCSNVAASNLSWASKKKLPATTEVANNA